MLEHWPLRLPAPLAVCQFTITVTVAQSQYHNVTMSLFDASAQCPLELHSRTSRADLRPLLSSPQQSPPVSMAGSAAVNVRTQADIRSSRRSPGTPSRGGVRPRAMNRLRAITRGQHERISLVADQHPEPLEAACARAGREERRGRSEESGEKRLLLALNQRCWAKQWAIQRKAGTKLQRLRSAVSGGRKLWFAPPQQVD